jgi:hypothetical protein
MTRRGVGLLVTVLVVVPIVTTMTMTMTTTAASAAKPTACEVLERAEIRRIVRQPVTRSSREQRTPKRASICNWDVGGRNRGALVSVWVQRGKQAREGFDVSERVFGLGSEPLPDLGDAGFYSSEAGAAYVLRGSEFLYVQRLDQTDATEPAVLRDQAVRLTELALERL